MEAKAQIDKSRNQLSNFHNDLPSQQPQLKMRWLNLIVGCTTAVLINAMRIDTNDMCTIDHPLPLAPGAPSQLFNFTSLFAGGERQYLLYLPASYKRTEPNPLILAFHGKTQTAATFENETQFSNPEFNDEAIVVYVQGLDVR